MKKELSTSVAMIQDTMERDCGHEVSYWKAWMAKQKILERLLGTYEESFQNLPKTLLAIKDSNPGTTITRDHKMIDGNKATFRRAFWAFNALINRFQYCCPLISIDNTHLYGKYKA
jgi:hypothetical protein